jgi:hypothetical protein
MASQEETSMKATALYRIASALLLVAAAGNTYGFVNFWRAAGLMSPVRFPWGHAGFSYAQVVMGFAMFSSLCVLFGAYLSWHLGVLARKTPQAIGALGWVLFAYQIVGFYISVIFLSGFVRILAAALVVCTGWAAWLSNGVRAKLTAAE